jgi:hypothetical protein
MTTSTLETELFALLERTVGVGLHRQRWRRDLLVTILLSERKAFGHPGIAPRWTRSAKDAVGTAYADSSRVWFTVARGILNEVYFPTVDRPQIRDLQYLIADGTTFFHDERRHLTSKVEYLDPQPLL